MDTSIVFFAEASVLCSAMLLVFILSIFRGTDKRDTRLLFAYTLTATAAASLLSILFKALSQAYFEFVDVLTYLVFFVMIAAVLLTGAFWFLFSEAMQQNPLFSTRRNKLLALIPAAVALVFAVAVRKTKLIISIRADRGMMKNVVTIRPGMYVLMSIAAAYIAVASVAALLRGIRRFLRTGRSRPSSRRSYGTRRR